MTLTEKRGVPKVLTKYGQAFIGDLNAKVFQKTVGIGVDTDRQRFQDRFFVKKPIDFERMVREKVA